MSIYATTLTIADDDHGDDCAKWIPEGSHPGIVVLDDDKPCTCLCGPLAYAGSHILPSGHDPHGGSFDLGAIPGFIETVGRPALSELEDWPYHPYLRVSVNQETVILTRGQVAQVHAEMGRWLEHTDEPDGTP